MSSRFGVPEIERGPALLPVNQRQSRTDVVFHRVISAARPQDLWRSNQLWH
jgi:hypothetical protein